MTKSLSPENYNIPSVFGYFNHDVRKRRSPAYTIGQRLHSTDSAANTPGPTTYEISPQATRFGEPGLPGCAFSQLARFQHGTQSNALAPCEVHGVVPGIDLSNPTLPKCPTGHHRKINVGSLPPPPNRYNLQSYKPGVAAPAFSFGREKRKLQSTQFKRRPKTVLSSQNLKKI